MKEPIICKLRLYILAKIIKGSATVIKLPKGINTHIYIRQNQAKK